MRHFLFGLVFFLALAATPAFADDAAVSTTPDPDAQTKAQIDSTNAEIQRLKDEIAALQQNLNLTTAQKQTLQTAIKTLDLQIQKLQKSVSLTSTQINQKDKEIVGIAGDIRTTEEKISDSQRAVGTSLRQLQQMDGEQVITTLFSSGTLSSFSDEAVTLGSLRGELQNKIQDLNSLHSTLQTTKQSAESKRQELSALKTNLNQQKQGVVVAKADQTTLLKETQNKETEYQKLIAQKKAEESSFESELIRLAAGLGPADTGSAPAPSKGILSWPLDSIRITQYFGNTEFAQSGAYNGHGHNGIDFRATTGTAVHTVLSGVVQEINQGAVKYCQYGKWVLVKHNNGLTSLYAHLSSIAVTKGQRISTGDLVGYSGDTGYATGPHLHLTLYISSAVAFKQYTCNSGKTAYIPIAPLNAYLNPLLYLPGL